MTSLFGRLVGAHHVEDACVDVLRYWYATYLHEVERVSGEVPGSLALPRSIRVSSEIDSMPEDQTPAIVIVSPGTDDIPGASGNHGYISAWEIEAACIVSAIGTQANGSPRALRLARMHALALRACLVQQTDGVYLFGRDWVGEEFNILPPIDDRTICVGTVRLIISVPDSLTRDAGPLEPLAGPDLPDIAPPLPSPSWPTAVEADVDLVKVPLEEDLT